MEDIQGWMITSAVVLLGFMASIVANRAQSGAAIRQNSKDIGTRKIETETVKKELVSHKNDRLSHSGVLVDEPRCSERRGTFKEDLERVENSISGLHIKIDNIIKNGKH